MDAMTVSATVPMDVQYPPAWLTWVSATTGCLRALGAGYDLADVAGFSGYAFLMTVHEDLCPSGPTVFDWSMLMPGMAHLGRKAEMHHVPGCHSEGHKNDKTRANCRMVFQAAAREIAAGRPCVIWGAYLPEFAIAVGVADGAYRVRSFKGHMKQPEPPIPWDEVDAPGGPYTLTFPESTQPNQADADRSAVAHALQMARAKPFDPRYATGLAAYDRWIAALQSNKAAGFGNAYNAQCWAEARQFAYKFLQRLAERSPGNSALKEAADAYGQVAEPMAKVAKLFPFFGEKKEVENADTRAAACQHLAAAKTAEARGLAALELGSAAP
ncbi:MAG TPA: hypothetical protein VNA25_12345 [Phycisphaerae bacterium]|nr:hypothetical protein [Phycisphaerae bacterium]